VRGLRPTRASRFLTEKAPKTLAFGHGGGYLVKYGVNDPLHIPLIQMWIVVCDLLDQF
jgi:hypothetical protein